MWRALQAAAYTRVSALTSKLAPYKGYLKERVQKLPDLSARRLLREIREQGYCGGYSTLARNVHSIRVSRPMPYELRFETDPGEQAQVDFAEFSVEPGRRRRPKRTILCVPNKVYDTNLQKFSTLGRFLVLTCLTLFITSFVPAAHAYEIISIIGAPSQINEGGSFTYRVRRTGSSDDLDYSPLQITLNVSTDNQVGGGFNFLIGGGATDSFEQTVSFGNGVREVSKTVRTYNNTVVNGKTQVVIALKDPTDEVLHGNSLKVLVVDDDVYTLRVRLVTAWQFPEHGNVQVKFERCVGRKNTEAITDCLDVTGPVRLGASTAPLTEEIFVEKIGNYFVGNLFDTLQKTVDGQVVTVDAVSLGENEFSKTFTLTPVDDHLDEPNGSLIIRTFPNSELSDQRKVLIQIRDNDQTRVRVDRRGPHPVDEGVTPTFVFKRFGTEFLSPATFKISLFYSAKLLSYTTTPLSRLQSIRFPQGVTEVVYRPLTTDDDAINEGDGRVAVFIDDVKYDGGGVIIAPYVGAGSSFAAFRVVDNDIPMVTLSVNTNSIVETESVDWLLTRDDYEETRLGVNVEDEYVKYYPDGLHPDQVTSSADILYIPVGTRSEVFPLVAGQHIFGPQGGYLKRRLLPFPTNRDREPLFWDDHPSFLPRYTVANSDWIQVDVTNNNLGVEVEAIQYSVTEGENARFTLKRDGGPAHIIPSYATRVRINVSQTENYLPANELGVRTVTIPVGQRSAT